MIAATHLSVLVGHRDCAADFVTGMADFHRAGGTVIHFRYLLLRWIAVKLALDAGSLTVVGAEVEDPVGPVLPARAAKAVSKFLDEICWRSRSSRLPGNGASEKAMELMREIGYFDELRKLGNAKACKDFLTKVHRDFGRFAERGMTLVDLAAWAAFTFGEVAVLVDERSARAPVPSVDGLPAGPRGPDPLAYDGLLRAALKRGHDRGFARLPDRSLRFELQDEVAGFFSRAFGFAVPGTDALLAAEAAGATLHDLVAAINRAATEGARVTELPAETRAGWERAFARVAGGPGTATADMTLAVHCLGFLPRISRHPVDPGAPSVYLEEIEALRLAADGGVAISDLLAAALSVRVEARAAEIEREARAGAAAEVIRVAF